jgi:hypothetical protein
VLFRSTGTPYIPIPEPKLPYPKYGPKEIVTPYPTLKLPPPPVTPPITPLPSKYKKPKLEKKKVARGYEVYVRRRKIFRKESPFALPREEALTFGARKALTSAAATFQLRATQEEAKSLGLPGAAPDLSKMFRPPKRREAPETYVQISTKRIVSPGEVREISLVGAAARRKSTPFKPFIPKKTSTSFLKIKKGKRMFF